MSRSPARALFLAYANQRRHGVPRTPLMSQADSTPPFPSLAAAMHELAGLLLATNSFQELVKRVAELSTRTVPAALTCGVTVAQDGRVVTIVSADPLGSLLDEQQYSLDEGPCLEALRTGDIVDAPDLSREDRWRSYPSRAMAHGVSAVYSSPLNVRDQTLGALNLYSATPHAFDSVEQRTSIAQIVALTGLAIAGTLRNFGDVTLTEQLQLALRSRSVIDQAMGIIMGDQHCSADQAFAILRGVSQTRNIRLTRIAQDIVDRTTASKAKRLH